MSRWRRHSRAPKPPPRRFRPPAAVAETGTAYAPSKGCRLAAERWPDGRVVCHWHGTWVEAAPETFKPSTGD